MIKQVSALRAGLCLCAAALQSVQGQDAAPRERHPRSRAITPVEAVRRATVSSEGEQALARARVAMAGGQYDRAYAEFRAAKTAGCNEDAGA